jgi:hypothetical protein
MVYAPGLTDLSVTINVGGQSLPEYNADSDPNRTSGACHVTKYVAATAGSEFSVVMNYGQVTKSIFRRGLRYDIIIDGNTVDTGVISEDRLQDRYPNVTVSTMRTKERDKYYQAKFAFGNLVLSME